MKEFDFPVVNVYIVVRWRGEKFTAHDDTVFSRTAG